MKIKLALLLTISFFICSCSSIKNKDLTDILNAIGSKITDYNTYHTGFKYYLPKGMNVKKTGLYNDEIESKDYIFYLYTDVISYYNKVQSDYEVKDDAFFSARLSSGTNFGYIEINLQENNQYLIEIMFNYAKIEVMVDYEDINLALEYAVSILRSIEYNDIVIASLVTDDVLSFQEEIYNIFDKTSSDSNYLKQVEEDIYVENNETVKDPDLIG